LNDRARDVAAVLLSDVQQSLERRNDPLAENLVKMMLNYNKQTPGALWRWNGVATALSPCYIDLCETLVIKSNCTGRDLHRIIKNLKRCLIFFVDKAWRRIRFGESINARLEQFETQYGLISHETMGDASYTAKFIEIFPDFDIIGLKEMLRWRQLVCASPLFYPMLHPRLQPTFTALWSKVAAIHTLVQQFIAWMNWRNGVIDAFTSTASFEELQVCKECLYDTIHTLEERNLENMQCDALPYGVQTHQIMMEMQLYKAEDIKRLRNARLNLSSVNRAIATREKQRRMFDALLVICNRAMVKAALENLFVGAFHK
jgi:hypothetical protein